MNPNMELEDVIDTTIANWFGDDSADGLSPAVYKAIRDWMNRNQIVFYQP